MDLNYGLVAILVTLCHSFETCSGQHYSTKSPYVMYFSSVPLYPVNLKSLVFFNGQIHAIS